MRLPKIDYLAPSSLSEALALLAEKGQAASVLAGGTDLLGRLRQRLVKPDVLVSLRNIEELKAVTLEGVTLRLGAAASLRTVMDHPEVRKELPGLAEALQSVGAAGIQHQRGAIGGNLLLDVRCLFYNQSDFWRSGRDKCFKNGGQVCHAVAESKECSASCQSDGAIMLAALSAQVLVKNKTGERLLGLAELFSGVGETPFTLAPEDLLCEIRIMLPPPGTGSSYQKLRWRSAVDYPLVSAAAVVSLSRGKVDRARLVIGAAGPAPLVIDDADKILRGQAPDDDLIDQAAAAARRKAEGVIVENAIAPAEYRRRMVRVMARRALKEAAARAGAE